MKIPQADQFLVNLVLQRTKPFIAAVRGYVAIYDDRESGSRKVIHA